MSRMNIVVVESPAKAKTINKYLGRDYKVIASYGHIRDLPAKDGSVLPDDDFAMSWEVDGKSEKHIREIAQALRGADRLFLPTDPDREGEAISWHVREVLKAPRALKGVAVKPAVFNEVTPNAVPDSFRHPRGTDGELVEAYLARRAVGGGGRGKAGLRREADEAGRPAGLGGRRPRRGYGRPHHL